MQRWIVRVLTLIAALAASCAAAAARDATTIERAESVASESRIPPPDSAAWRAVGLPDNWQRSRPGFSGQVWYRLEFITSAAKRTHALYVPRNSAAEIEFFVNGEPLALNRGYGDTRITELQRPLIFTVPQLMLRERDNVMHVRVAGSAENRHGLSRLTIGNGLVVRPSYYEPRYDLQVQSIAMFGAALLVAGLLALAVWLGESGARGEPVILWFGVTALAWALSAGLLVWPARIANAHAQQVLLFAAQHLYVIPLIVLCVRTGGARYPRLEALLWFGFAAACGAAALLGFERYPSLVQAAWAAKLLMTVSALAWLVRVGVRDHRWPLYPLGLALAMLVVFSGYDWARWMGFADFDNLLLAPFAMPFLILALGASSLDRHLSMARELKRGKRELEHKVAQRVREVEQTYKKMQEVLSQQALLRERQRIMTDMHDGLGSGLIGLLSQVHGRSADLNQIELRLNGMLTDLRAIVDSLQPVEGDLGVVLGNIRYRMSQAIEASGVRFIWQVEPLPPLADLTPDKVLSIQRIMLEALSNALRHAAASTMTVSANVVQERNAIVIVIADDGVGFTVDAAERGHGLRNMRSRAQRMGIALEINSSPGRGTRVMLELSAGTGAPSV